MYYGLIYFGFIFGVYIEGVIIGIKIGIIQGWEIKIELVCYGWL